DCVVFGFGTNSGRDGATAISDARTTGGQLFVSNVSTRDNANGGFLIAPSSGGTRISATLNNVQIIGSGNAGLGALSGIATANDLDVVQRRADARASGRRGN